MKKKKRSRKMSFEEIVNVMLRDKRVRLNIVKRSHRFFFYYYFPHYTEFEIAPFQKEMFHITQNTAVPTTAIVGFRGCGKSVILSLSFPLWAILGEQKIKYVLILSQTQQKAQMLLQQIKYELETNELLKKDLGPFQEERNQWNIVSLYLTRYNAKIAVASVEQSIRSWRHMQYRPQLIICDDPEDLESVKTNEGRDKLHNWLLGDVIPAGGRNTRLFITGGLLHEDSLLKRVQKSIGEGRMNGIYREYPILDKEGNPTWPGKFRTMEDVDAEKRKIGDDIVWQREYLLRIVSDKRRVIHPEWLHYYDYDTDLPSDQYLRRTYIGMDLAISEKDSADCTAIVILKIYRLEDKRIAYVMPYPFNERATFPEQINQIKILATNKSYYYPELFIEKTGYQEAFIQQCESLGIRAEGIPPRGDKRGRLALTTAAIKEGLIRFPKKGAEELIFQLTGFGAEKHDDLADAFALAASQFIIYCNAPPPLTVTFIKMPGPPRGGSLADENNGRWRPFP